MPCDHAWVFRIQARPYVERPLIQSASFISIDKPLRVTLAAEPADAQIRYTLDGAEPTPASPLCTAPLRIDRSGLLRVRAFRDGYAPSLTVEQQISVLSSSENGLTCRYYEGEWEQLPDFDALKPVRELRAWDFSFAPVIKREENFSVVFDGFLRIDRPGLYTFFTRSDDGSRLWIDGRLVVDNDGLHGAREAQGKIELAPGRHALRVGFLEKGGQELLQVSF
ncbi:MAG TPA: PA14 domain-containing protein, partial [bacterium]|nr:PA14 domain-containing protein [bacterium]